MTRFDLEETYLSLDGAGAVAEHPVDAGFWATIDRNTALKGTLVAVFRGNADWDHWEMHPAGDEILVLIEGTLTMLLQRDGDVTRHLMVDGSTLVVPAGVWHRALIDRPTRLMAITYGAGTTHRPA